MRPSWDEYFYQLAKLVSTRSTCPRANCGCVIIDNNNFILATGYNGVISGEPHCEEVGCKIIHGHCSLSIHAEANAVLQALKRGIDLKNSKAYVYRKNILSKGSGCCPDCKRLLLAAGVELIGCKDE